MTSTKPKTTVCRCTDCGKGCSQRKTTEKPGEKQPQGFFATRPWIWIVFGYLAMVGALGSMVVIAVKHQQAEVPLIHGR